MTRKDKTGCEFKTKKAANLTENIINEHCMR